MRSQAITLAFSVVMISAATGIYGQNSPASQSQSNGKPRVFITGGQPADANSSATAEITKAFGQQCVNAQLESGPTAADYLVAVDAPSATHHKGKVMVLDRRSGDPVGGKSAAFMDALLTDACEIITAQWATHSDELLGMREIENVLEPQHNAGTAAAPQAAATNTANVSITSTPSGADVNIDGNYVGSTPSEVKLPPGMVLIKIQKKGFNAWERKLKISGGDVKVSADLETSGTAQ